MPKVLIIGGGGREDALASVLCKEADILVAPGNAGSTRYGERLPLDISDTAAIVAVAKDRHVDVVVVGPEQPLVSGVVDAFRDSGIVAFGPDKASARLEGSKVFAKEMMRECGIPTADYAVFNDAEQAKAYIREAQRPLVVKADGLAAGKGVVVAKDAEEACEAVERIMVERVFGDAGATVLIEECLVGPEVSFHALCDGERFVSLATAQDHKRALEGDKGPNTGGMGSYSPAPVATPQVVRALEEDVVAPLLRGMSKRDTPFRGVLFVGAMIVDGKPQVLEFNVRFGDPETQVLMARLDEPLLPLLRACANGELENSRKVHFGAGHAMCVVLTSKGYPASYKKGVPIKLSALETGTTLFHAGTTHRDGQLVTSGGRVLGVTGTGRTLLEAKERAYQGASKVSFDGCTYRKDIGWRALSS